MSFDLILTPLGDFDCLEDVPKDFVAGPIGNAASIPGRLMPHMPGLTFEGSGHGVWESESGAVAVSYGGEDPVTSIHLALYGDVRSLMPRVVDLAAAMNCRIIDCQTSEFYSAKTGEKSVSAWRRFRDKVVNLYT